MKKIKTLCKELYNITSERKELEIKEKAIKASLIEELKANKLAFADTEYGKAKIARRPYYTYSKVVEAMEEQVKLKKIEEVEKGIAEESVTEYILFKELK